MTKVAFQGVPGAYSEDAVIRFFGEVDTLPCPDFGDLGRALKEGRASHAMLPVENSIEGSVSRANDLLIENDFTVIGEVTVPIRHCLISHPGTAEEDVKRVYSHPQALAQCRKYLEAHPDWEKVPAYDTAGSVKLVEERNENGEAAIASDRAADRYRMDVVRRDIQDSVDNQTRFLVICRHAEPDPEGDRTSLIFATRDVPGALYQCLGTFAKNGVNMTKLESRPRKDRTWEYVFIVDIEGNLNDAPVAKALGELVTRAAFVKVLGCYRRSGN
jgi:prephenate dehydratase